MLKLTSHQRSALKAQAHDLNPVVMIGDAGLTDAVLKEIDISLNAHGLIKIRVFGDDRINRIEILQTICTELHAAPVQHIGKLLVVYRPKKEKDKTEPALSSLKKTTAKKRSGKPALKGNERLTQGGLIKRKKLRQTSLKKKTLSR